MPLARSEGEGEVLTPGGSAVILVPENIVSILAVGGGLNEVPIRAYLAGTGWCPSQLLDRYVSREGSEELCGIRSEWWWREDNLKQRRRAPKC